MFFWNFQQLLKVLFSSKRSFKNKFCRNNNFHKNEILETTFAGKKLKVSSSFKSNFERIFKKKLRGETVEKSKCYAYIHYVSRIIS